MNDSFDPAISVVMEEARLLDEKRWDDWLALYTDDAVFWMPTWRDEHTLTSDPDQELSFIYLAGKSFLKERVSRAQSRISVAAMPAPRTCHVVSNAHAMLEQDTVVVYSSWVSYAYQHKDKALTTYCGRYEHRLRRHDSGYLIEQKKIILINDYLQSKLDFYYV